MSAIRASSLLIVAPSKRVLFMQRPAKGSFAGVHVFPGGALEPGDASLLNCALRETYEETGIVVDPVSKNAVLFGEPDSSYSDALNKAFPRNSADIDWAAITGFPKISEWTTPAGVNRKRFETQFFLYEAPQEIPVGKSPTSEAVKLEWLHPSEVLAQYTDKKVALYPPQFYLMTMLETYPLESVVEQLENRVIKPTPVEKRADGRVRFDYGNGQSAINTLDKNGAIVDIELTSKL